MGTSGWWARRNDPQRIQRNAMGAPRHRISVSKLAEKTSFSNAPGLACKHSNPSCLGFFELSVGRRSSEINVREIDAHHQENHFRRNKPPRGRQTKSSKF